MVTQQIAKIANNKWAGVFWKVVQTIILAILVYCGNWLKTKVDQFNNNLRTIEENKRSNEAQWGVIKSLREDLLISQQKVAETEAQWQVLYEERHKRRDLEAEVEAYKKLFKLLLDQNRIRVNEVTVPGREEESLGDDVESFRTEQVERHRKSK